MTRLPNATEQGTPSLVAAQWTETQKRMARHGLKGRNETGCEGGIVPQDGECLQQVLWKRDVIFLSLQLLWLTKQQKGDTVVTSQSWPAAYQPRGSSY